MNRNQRNGAAFRPGLSEAGSPAGALEIQMNRNQLVGLPFALSLSKGRSLDCAFVRNPS